MSRGTKGLVGLVVAILAGCSAGPNIAEFDPKAKPPGMITVINDSGLQADAEMIPGKALYQEQLMQCSMQIQSHKNKGQKLYYTWRWVDADGYPAADDPWHFLKLDANDAKLVTGTATNPKVVKGQFLLRRPSKEDHEN